MIKLYLKRIPILAVQWTGTNLEEVIGLTGRHQSAADWSWEKFKQVVTESGLKIFTLEGPLMASVGDYIIKGHDGEVYPCNQKIFEATYEEVIG